MTLDQQKKFLNDLVANRVTIFEEFLKARRRAQPLPDWDVDRTPVKNWKGIGLWWDHTPWPFTQRLMPKTTELVRNGPDHRATGFVILDPHSRTPQHNHNEWGKKIILHLPIVVPEGDTGFWIDGKVHHWCEGKLFAFDVQKDHYGYNNTDQERVIFLMDFDAAEWGETLAPYMTN